MKGFYSSLGRTEEWNCIIHIYRDGQKVMPQGNCSRYWNFGLILEWNMAFWSCIIPISNLFCSIFSTENYLHRKLLRHWSTLCFCDQVYWPVTWKIIKAHPFHSVWCFKRIVNTSSIVKLIVGSQLTPIFFWKFHFLGCMIKWYHPRWSQIIYVDGKKS